MAGWPRDNRDNVSSSLMGKKHGPRAPTHKGYPHIEPGMMGAATLVEDQGRLKWSLLTERPSKDVLQRHLRIGAFGSWFPTTRTLPRAEARKSARRRVQEGTEFLNAYLPDVDVSTQLLHEHFAEDASLAEELDKFNPFAGNLLGVYETGTQTSLLFPMGEVQQDLNISTLCQEECESFAFKPSTVPAYLFQTPIEQIIVSPTNEDAALAVRTYGSVEFFGLKQQKKGHVLTNVGSIPSTIPDLGQVTDVQFLPLFWEVLIATSTGAVLHCNIGDGLATKTLVPPLKETVTDKFWRLSLGTNPDVCFHLNGKTVACLDTKQERPSTFYEHSGKGWLTSVDVDDQHNLVHLCTTEQLIWMDIRVANRPLLCLGHNRQHDRYLRTETHQISDRSLTFLTTRNNSLVTVYDVARSGELISMRDNPYCLAMDTDIYKPYCGFSLLNRPRGAVFVSEECAVTFAELCVESIPSVDVVVEQSKDFTRLKTKSAKQRSWGGTIGTEEFQELDLRRLYDEIFACDLDKIEHEEEAKKDSIYDVMDNMSSFWNRLDAPVENILTTFDIALRSGEEPDTFARADLLTSNLVNSKRGHREIQRGRLKPEDIKAPWRASLVNTIQCLDKDFEADPEKRLVYLDSFDKAKDPDGRRYEALAKRELAVDLSLSTDIFSERPFLHRHDPEVPLEALTEALSLAGGPPAVMFHLFEPMEEREGKGGRSELHPPEMSMGVRLLLNDWDTRLPEEYSYRDVYGFEGSSKSEVGSQTPPPTQPRGTMAQSQRPPEVVAAGVPRLPPMIASSQVVEPVVKVWERETQSQELFTSTQIVAGPHGGRPGAKKKKRIGGF